MNTASDADIWNIRQKAGMVFQNPDNQIIGTVVEEDVGFGPENLGVPTEDIWKRVDESLKAVGMTAYRHHSPNKLSGGQKQRLTIARAITGKPSVLILDDSMSALDYATDLALRRALQTKMQNVTKIIVSQRATSIQHADHILVMDDGTCVGYGTHDQLLEHCPVYADIYRTQMQ